MVTKSLDLEGEIRCNKVTTIRNLLLLEKIGELRFEYHDKVLEKIKNAFKIIEEEDYSDYSIKSLK